MFSFRELFGPPKIAIPMSPESLWSLLYLGSSLQIYSMFSDCFVSKLWIWLHNISKWKTIGKSNSCWCRIKSIVNRRMFFPNSSCEVFLGRLGVANQQWCLPLQLVVGADYVCVRLYKLLLQFLWPRNSVLPWNDSLFEKGSIFVRLHQTRNSMKTKFHMAHM